MSQLENKRKLWVFIPTKTWPSGYLADLVVYSYLAYQDRYDTLPTKTQLAKVTGLSLTGVSSALDRLEGHGLFFEGRPQAPQSGWLVPKSGEGHWSLQLAGWCCYTRSHNSAITFIEACLYSYIRHCIDTNFVPPSGWTYAFLGHSLCCGRDTIKRCLESLHGRLLDFSANDDGGLKIGLYQPIPSGMLSAFSDKGEYNPKEPKGSIGYVVPPGNVQKQTGDLSLICLRQGHDIDFLKKWNLTTQEEYDFHCRTTDRLEVVYQILVKHGFMEGHGQTKKHAREFYVANQLKVDGIEEVVVAERQKGPDGVGERVKAALRSNQEAV